MTNIPNMTNVEAVYAGNLTVGDAVIERDGYMWAVIKIERKGAMVQITLANDFSPMHDWRSDRGIVVRKRSSTRVSCVRDAGKDVIAPDAMVAFQRAAMSALASDPA